jgi:hypothetical protein
LVKSWKNFKHQIKTTRVSIGTAKLAIKNYVAEKTELKCKLKNCKSCKNEKHFFKKHKKHFSFNKNAS